MEGNKQNFRIPINENYLLTVNCADYQVILTRAAYDMEFVLKRLCTEYMSWELKVRIEGTEYMTINTDAKLGVLINEDVQVKQVDNFQYL